MALLQIAEPGQSPQPHQRRLAVGIDLGTTNSLVAALRSGITAPLAANVNDKGNAFGGSLASVLTLSGWALVSLRLRLAGHDAEVYVADSNLRYLAPVYEDLHAHAEAAEATGWDAFLNTFRQRRKARISIIATQPGADGKPAAEFSGRFVAFAKG